MNCDLIIKVLDPIQSDRMINTTKLIKYFNEYCLKIFNISSSFFSINPFTYINPEDIFKKKKIDNTCYFLSELKNVYPITIHFNPYDLFGANKKIKIGGVEDVVEAFIV